MWVHSRLCGRWFVLEQVQLKQGATGLRSTGYAWDNADQITSQTVNGWARSYTCQVKRRGD